MMTATTTTMKMKAMASLMAVGHWQGQQAGGGKSAAEAGSAAARRRRWGQQRTGFHPSWSTFLRYCVVSKIH